MRNTFLLLVTLAAFAIGCRNDVPASGVAQPATPQTAPTNSTSATNTVTLAQLVASPDLYEGKTVSVEGTYNGACGDGDYYFKDKFDLIEFEIVEPDVPRADVEKLEKGSRVRLHGRVKVRRHAPEEPKPEGAENTERAEREAEVHIAANLVEVIR